MRDCQGLIERAKSVHIKATGDAGMQVVEVPQFLSTDTDGPASVLPPRAAGLEEDKRARGETRRRTEWHGRVQKGQFQIAILSKSIKKKKKKSLNDALPCQVSVCVLGEVGG